MSPSKPRLEPVRRDVPRAPERSRRRSSFTPFPPARLIPLDGEAPEDVVVDASGCVLTGVAGGRILRINPVTNEQQIIGDTGGRPLGLEVLADGRVLVCDADKGLLRLDPQSGATETLVAAVGGVPLRFCSNAVQASDGTIYFTEATSRFDFEHYVGSFLEHRGAGRLFRRDLDGTVHVLLENLYFANGLALTPDESALLFVETGAYRISRLELSGKSAGRVHVIADNLPGMPDNMSKFIDGHVWVPLTNPRSRALDLLAVLPAAAAKLAWAIPERLRPAGRKTTWLMAFDQHGEIVADLQESRADYRFVTGVAEHRGQLYCAGLQNKAILALELP